MAFLKWFNLSAFGGSVARQRGEGKVGLGAEGEKKCGKVSAVVVDG